MAVRTWLNSDFYNKLPSDVRPKVKLVSKITQKYLGGTFSAYSTSDYVFLLSASEVFGNPATYISRNEGVKYPIFASNASRALSRTGSTEKRWLTRSISEVDGACIAGVSADGSYGTGMYFYYDFGLCLAFCV